MDGNNLALKCKVWTSYANCSRQVLCFLSSLGADGDADALRLGERDEGGDALLAVLALRRHRRHVLPPHLLRYLDHRLKGFRLDSYSVHDGNPENLIQAYGVVGLS